MRIEERRDTGDRLIIEMLIKDIENGEGSRIDTWTNINGGSGVASQSSTGISIGGSQQYVEFLEQDNAYRRKKDESRDSRDKSIIEMLLNDLEYDEGSRRDIETGGFYSCSRPIASQPAIGPPSLQHT